jgi:hypothetical protein
VHLLPWVCARVQGARRAWRKWDGVAWTVAKGRAQQGSSGEVCRARRRSPAAWASGRSGAAASREREGRAWVLFGEVSSCRGEKGLGPVPFIVGGKEEKSRGGEKTAVVPSKCH